MGAHGKLLDSMVGSEFFGFFQMEREREILMLYNMAGVHVLFTSSYSLSLSYVSVGQYNLAGHENRVPTNICGLLFCRTP